MIKCFLLGFLLSFLVVSVAFVGLADFSCYGQSDSLFVFERDGYEFRVPVVSYPNTVVSYEDRDNEFEINFTLIRKTAVSSFAVPFAGSGLKFYYQPALDVELKVDDYDFVNETHAVRDGEVVCYRPENVVGSYAVYVDGVCNGWTGKLLHIYRPFAVDAEGDMVWCDLDVTGNVLWVRVSGDWLSSAVYPVVIDPVFGYDTIGGSFDSWVASYVLGCKFPLSESGTLTKISFYGRLYTAGNMKTGVWDDNGGDPNDLVAESASGSVSTGDAWYNFTVSYEGSVEDYWLGWVADQTFRFYYDSGDSYQSAYRQSQSYPTLPDPFAKTGWVSGTGAQVVSIFATYTASGGDSYVGDCGGVLNAPVNDSSTSVFTNLMNATFSLVGNSSDYFINATLYVDNSPVAYNGSALVNATLFSISYEFPSNGTYIWDILVWNSTHGVWSGNGNWSLTVGVYEDNDVYVGVCYGSLVEPVDDYNSTTASNTFNYTAFLVGNSSDYFNYARLYVNGNYVTANGTAVVNGTYNVITYSFTANGTYLWDIRLYNSTSAVWSSNGNYSITVGFYSDVDSDSIDSDTLYAVLLIVLGFVFMMVVVIVVVKKRQG